MKTIDISKAKLIVGFIHDTDLLWLAEQARERKMICEIGSWKGASARAMADNTEGQIYCVDTFLGSPDEVAHQEARNYDLSDIRSVLSQFTYNMKEHIDSGKVNVLVHSSDDAAIIFSKLKFKFDMIFIDSLHEYEQVVKDIKNYLPLLIEGGLLCGHDCYYPSVANAVNDSLKGYTCVSDTSIWRYYK